MKLMSKHLVVKESLVKIYEINIQTLLNSKYKPEEQKAQDAEDFRAKKAKLAEAQGSSIKSRVKKLPR